MKKYKRKKYKKAYRIRKKKSLFRSRFFCLSFLLFILLAGLFYLFIFSSVFQIKEVKISGNIKVPVEGLRNTISEQADKKIAFFNLKNIFLANLKEIDEALLENFPQIAKVNLNRRFPNVLAAEIEERKPVAVFCQYRDCFFIDKDGIIFEKVPETSEMFKIRKSTFISDLDLGKEIVGKEQIAQILKINSKLNDFKVPFEEVLIASERRFNALISEGWEIYFNPERDLDWQLTRLDILLKERIPPEKRKNLEYIDLRFEKIYIYPETYNQ